MWNLSGTTVHRLRSSLRMAYQSIVILEHDDIFSSLDGEDRVALLDGVYYCPVRENAIDVDSGLCPFCPAR